VKIPFKANLASMLPFYAGLRKKCADLEERNRTLNDRIARLAAQRRLFEDLYAEYLDLRLRHDMPERGTKEWFEVMEFKYGGTIREVERKKVSDSDPRTQQELRTGGMVGGDRMSRLEHDYGQVFESCLRPFVRAHHRKVVLAEVGILKGTGLAIWAELFDDARVLGFDIDLSHIHANMDDLRRRGAFKNNNVELYEFDQYKDNRALLEGLLRGDRFDVVIDDGVHYDQPVIATLESCMPFLADEFVYIIEDNATVAHRLMSLYGHYAIESIGEITVVKNRVLQA